MSGRKRIIFALKLLFSAAMLVVIGQKVFGRDGAIALGEALRSLNVGWLGLAAGAQLAAIACSVVRWRALLIGQGIHAPLGFLSKSFMIARFWGAFTPGGFTGLGGWRIYDIAKHTGKTARATATIGIEMVLGQLAFGAVVMAGSIYGFRFLGTTGVILVNAGFIGLMSVGLLTLARPNWLRFATRFLPRAFEARIQSLVDAICAYQGKARLLAFAGVLGIGTHAFNNLIYVCAARALGADLGIGEVFFGSSLQILSTLLPAFINGVGIREATAVALYTSVGIPKTTALLIPVLGFAVEMAISSVGGVLFLLRRSERIPHIAVEDPERERIQHEAIPKAPREAWPKLWPSTYLGAAAGLVGGAMVGVGEAFIITLGAGEAVSGALGHSIASGALAFLYGAALYGAIGAGLGAGAGLVFAWTGRITERQAAPVSVAYARILGLVAAMLALPLTLFRVRRDLFAEQLVWKSFQGVGVLAGSAVAALLLYAAAVLLAGFLAKHAYCTRSKLVKSAFVSYLAVLLPVTALASALGSGVPPVRFDQSNKRGAAGEAGASKQNILFIVVDTLRADHLPAYGYTQSRTPHLDAFAKDAVRFENAFANASWTRPSFASLLTGRLPKSHGVMSKSSALSDSLDTLPEVLRKNGYTTAGVVTNYNVAPYFNFAQGFDHYTYLEPDFPLGANDQAAKLLAFQFVRQKIESLRALRGSVEPGGAYQDARVVNAHIDNILDAQPKEPWFLFAGYMDPHDPYFVHPYNGTGYARAAHQEPKVEERDKLRSLYDGEIRYFDKQFGALIASLKRRGIYDDLTIVITSDHGEEFAEHGGFWHGTTLYDEQLRVPLFVKLAKNARGGETKSAWVQSIDVMPTLLSQLNIDSPASVQGGDLFEGSNVVYAEESHEGNVLQSLRQRVGTEAHKVIEANPGNPRGLEPVEVYRVDRDPGETRNLAELEPALRTQTLEALAEAETQAKKGALKAKTVELEHDSDAAERLKALGYAVE